MKKFTTLVLLFTASVSMTLIAAEVSQTVPVKRFVDTGSLVVKTPKVTVMADDPVLMQHIKNVQRKVRRVSPISSAAKKSSRKKVQVIQLAPKAVSSTAVNATKAFLFQNITPPDTNSAQGNTQVVSSTERLQQVEFYRRSIANQKRVTQ